MKGPWYKKFALDNFPSLDTENDTHSEVQDDKDSSDTKGKSYNNKTQDCDELFNLLNIL